MAAGRLGAPKAEVMLVASILGFLGPPIALTFTHVLSSYRPLKLDQFVYQLDGLLGFQPSFVLGRLVQASPAAIDTLAFAYGLLPAVFLAVFYLHLTRRSDQETKEVAWGFTLNLFLAVPIYILFPVCGPLYGFPNYPSLPAAMSPHAIAIAAPPNGVPSVHCSSALLILYYFRHWRFGIWIGAVFLVLTVLATLGSGEHYFFDLVAAVPYAVLVAWIARRLGWGKPREMSRTNVTSCG
jgi:hypothetical protein